MSSSVTRAVHFVELAIIAQEGALVVDGIPFTSAVDAELARRALAERAVAEASLLCRYVALHPSCGRCGYPIAATQHAREIGGQLYHDEDSLACAQDFEDEVDAFVSERLADAR